MLTRLSRYEQQGSCNNKSEFNWKLGLKWVYSVGDYDFEVLQEFLFYNAILLKNWLFQLEILHIESINDILHYSVPVIIVWLYFQYFEGVFRGNNWFVGIMLDVDLSCKLKELEALLNLRGLCDGLESILEAWIHSCDHILLLCWGEDFQVSDQLWVLRR